MMGELSILETPAKPTKLRSTNWDQKINTNIKNIEKINYNNTHLKISLSFLNLNLK
jgi:hypothetical protein